MQLKELSEPKAALPQEQEAQSKQFTLYKARKCFSAGNTHYVWNASEAPEHVMATSHRKGSCPYLSHIMQLYTPCLLQSIAKFMKINN